MRTITHILVHHTASAGKTTTIHGVNEYHKTKNWGTEAQPAYAKVSSLGWFVQYHYFIDWHGVVTQCHEDEDVSWHGNNANPFSLGICLAGWFDPEHDTEGPSHDQIKALQALLIRLVAKYNLGPEHVVPHRAYNPTKSCYGSLLAEDWARSLLNAGTIHPPKPAIPYLPYFQMKPGQNGIAVYDPDTDSMIAFRSGRSFKALFGDYQNVKVDKTSPDWLRPLSNEFIDIIS